MSLSILTASTPATMTVSEHQAVLQRRALYQAEFGLRVFLDPSGLITFHGGPDAAVRVVAMPPPLGSRVRNALRTKDLHHVPIVASRSAGHCEQWLFLTAAAPTDPSRSLLFASGTRFAANNVVLRQGVMTTLPTPGRDSASWINPPSGRDQPQFQEIVPIIHTLLGNERKRRRSR
ncbi:hypothetical protein F5X71_34475 [Nocardia brasiliensis]|uniref:Uncharacterized protein n=1 Tax=Nocardia brasiliensis TaxID=37326 RepID=A0A6G9Y0P0_NOCBR|nr:hypothetical protein [Nocardia brasiliensis]QIS06734.1 hypothetical protein F5X71_34475 [Nocardia brasiliensis]